MQGGGWQAGWYAGRPAAAAVLGLALVLFGAAVWDAVMRLQRLQAPAARGLEPATGHTGAESAYRVDEIIAAGLFGQPAAQAPPVAKEAPATRLNLTLLGVVAARDPRLARAVIQVQGQEARAYRVGETIGATGAVVRTVEAKRVLIERNGVVESLPLNEPSLEGSTPVAGLPGLAPASAAPAGRSGGRGAPGPGPGPAAAGPGGGE